MPADETLCPQDELPLSSNADAHAHGSARSVFIVDEKVIFLCSPSMGCTVLQRVVPCCSRPECHFSMLSKRAKQLPKQTEALAMNTTCNEQKNRRLRNPTRADALLLRLVCAGACSR